MASKVTCKREMGSSYRPRELNFLMEWRTDKDKGTVFENHRKSLILQLKRTEICGGGQAV